MKKLLLTLVFTTISIVSFSQVKVRPGLKVGMNSSTVTNIENASRVSGLQAAMFLNIHFSRVYELQIEASYSNQGYKQDAYTLTNPYNSQLQHVNGKEVTINYIGAAVSNKFFFIPDVGLHILVGPSLEVNVSDSSHGDIIPIDLAFFVGIGYEFPMGLGLEARYKQGIVDVRDNYYYDPYFDPDYSYSNDYYYNGNNGLNSVFQFSVYYKFGF
ncbi:outer membrane beta-barrel protein [Bizionia sp. KMM 8389]